MTDSAWCVEWYRASTGEWEPLEDARLFPTRQKALDLAKLERLEFPEERYRVKRWERSR